MFRNCSALFGVFLCFPFLIPGLAANTDKSKAANRLTYLDSNDPFYVGRDFPKLITPQWVGEPGVDAVVTLAIDDMTRTDKYEAFLRPILKKLKSIDGRAAVSIMTQRIDAPDPQLQTWLSEGVSLETHTVTHPCPCLAKGDFQFASSNYHGSVEMLNRVPGNRPVAFRMPCCDSMNSPSPRFYAEIFNRTNSLGQFLSIDSSVMNITTTNDTSLPRSLVLQADGVERFRKYLPFPAFATTIEDYPYPYVIGKLCWEFPAVVPTDWEAQHLHGTNNPATVADWKAALDVTVSKRGTMNLIFHPHGWILPEQIVELIDYSVQRYGKRVKFLTFREAQERLDNHLLHGTPLRGGDGQDNGVRLLDLNDDGYLDLVIANNQRAETWLWDPQELKWAKSAFPVGLVTREGSGQARETGMRFGLVRAGGRVSALLTTEKIKKAWTFIAGEWKPDDALLSGLEFEGTAILTLEQAGGELRDRGVRFRDVNGDGACELLVGNEKQNALLEWSEKEKQWQRLSYSLPEQATIVNEKGQDNGLRFVDVNEDGFDDVLYSNEKTFSLHLYIPKVHLGFKIGWSRMVLSGQRGDFGELPMMTRNGSNNGAWTRNRTLWVQNEDTANLPDKVDRRTFDDLLRGLQPPSLSPEESLKALRVKPGFKAELVAHEPLIQSPVAFEWSADGKLWVVEMTDYPSGVDGKGKPGGAVRFLEDTNHDGFFDKSTVFLKELNFPTGIFPWGKGVIISASPEIFYAEDTDGDKKADLRKVLFTGFREGNQQHRVNGFEYGLDNWVYGANGDSGGQIRSELTGKTVSISGRDFRFRPGDSSLETQAGGTQFGRHKDDWGNWFGNNNSTWVWHYFLPEQYLVRNRHLAVRDIKRTTATYPESTRVYYVSHLLQRFNDIWNYGHVTSACSAMPYRDEILGEEFDTSVFICEPVHNLVHREVLEPDGISFLSHRSSDEERSEFLASSDNWFRPVMAKTGPDGALYIADMHRFVIEHPEWIPDDAKERLDLRAGHEKGRIYRVYPEGKQLRAVPDLNALEIGDLVAAIDSPNGWQRDTIQQLLVERGDKAAKGALIILFEKSERPKTKIQILGTLEGLGGAPPEVLQKALRDPHPAVREQAVRACDALLRKADTDLSGEGRTTNRAQAALVESLLALVEDPSIRVRYQVAFTLGECSDHRAGKALVTLATRDADEPEMETAVLTSAPSHISEMLIAAFDVSRGSAPQLLDKLLGLAASMKADHALAQALSKLAKLEKGQYAAWQFSALCGFLDALDRRGESLKRFYQKSGRELRGSVDELSPLFGEARIRLKNEAITGVFQEGVESKIGLLARSLDQREREQDLEQLAGLLEPRFPAEVQQRALAGMRRSDSRRASELMLSRWHGSSPDLRAAMMQTLLTRQDWIDGMLVSIEHGRIPSGQIGLVEQKKLLKHESKTIRARAEKIFGAVDPDRQRILVSLKEVATMKGNPERGALLFQQTCEQCHGMQKGRSQPGPDLRALADKTTESLLIAIFDPNRAVEARYVNYNAVTRNGQEISGIIVGETGNSITLRSTSGEVDVLRTDLESLASSGLSLMPEGLEKVLKPQDAADVIAYVRTLNRANSSH
jgi:putative membrane-bound dehydrogenase-like protein